MKTKKKKTMSLSLIMVMTMMTTVMLDDVDDHDQLGVLAC